MTPSASIKSRLTATQRGSPLEWRGERQRASILVLAAFLLLASVNDGSCRSDCLREITLLVHVLDFLECANSLAAYEQDGDVVGSGKTKEQWLEDIFIGYTEGRHQHANLSDKSRVDGKSRSYEGLRPHIDGGTVFISESSNDLSYASLNKFTGEEGVFQARRDIIRSEGQTLTSILNLDDRWNGFQVQVTQHLLQITRSWRVQLYFAEYTVT